MIFGLPIEQYEDSVGNQVAYFSVAVEVLCSPVEIGTVPKHHKPGIPFAFLEGADVVWYPLQLFDGFILVYVCECVKRIACVEWTPVFTITFCLLDLM